MTTTKKDKPRHTCDTAPSGSERSENTCTACQEEMRCRPRHRSHSPTCPDYTAMWLKQVWR